MFSVSRVWFHPVSAEYVRRLPSLDSARTVSPASGAVGAAKLPIVSVPRVGFESITRSGKPVTPARRGGADRLSRTGQIRRDTAESRRESDATTVQRKETRIPLAAVVVASSL